MAEAKRKAAKADNKAKDVTEAASKKAPPEVKESKDGIVKKTGETASKASQKPEAEAVATNAPAKTAAKAGKRSEKAIKEAEEKQAKEERKAKKVEADEDKSAKPKVTQKPPRSRLERRGKKFRKAAELIEKGKAYSIKEAIDLAAKTSASKFDATVELHVRLGVDPRQADQNIRDMVALPAGTGKTVRVAVIADPEGVSAAKQAGADIASGDEFLQELEKGAINFDMLIATPSFMPKLGKYARVLGPKGLMPNPKSGTVTNDVAKAVKEAKAGRVEYRVDVAGIVHVGFGKTSFGPDKLLQNATAILNSIKNNKPASIKGSYVKSVFVTTSMGPSIPVSTGEI